MPVRVIGVMSGSSLDGLDMALCRFEGAADPVQWDLLDARTVAFPDMWSQDLKSSYLLNGYNLMQLDAELGLFIGRQLASWMKENGLEADFIASHGHTVFHEPGAGFTTQIGSGAHIATLTGLDTITTFRSADVAAGGQGAPFAPIADRFLFPGYDGYLNLGGIANVSIRTKSGAWKAWDIGPCNQALNHLAAKEGHAYDADGRMAALGSVNESIVQTLVDMFPYEDGRPRAMSNAEVHASWIRFLDSRSENNHDLMASVTAAIARMIAHHFVLLPAPSPRVLATGGGAHNASLLRHLHAATAKQSVNFHLPEARIIDYKECALMAYLGFLTMEGKPFPIRHITGASVDTIGGAVHKATR